MIAWLQGEKVENWQQGAKVGIVLSCKGVGYEIQLLSRHRDTIEAFKTENPWEKMKKIAGEIEDCLR